jgi:hypothetical protein
MRTACSRSPAIDARSIGFTHTQGLIGRQATLGLTVRAGSARPGDFVDGWDRLMEWIAAPACVQAIGNAGVTIANDGYESVGLDSS